MKMSGNTVVITGGVSGIGYALAKYFVRDNTVLICGRRVDRLEQASKELGVQTFQADLADPAGRQALANHVEAALGGVNVLVNNAGIQRDIDLTAGVTALDAGEDEIGINLVAPIQLSALFTPLLKGKPGATIVNVSSALAFMVERATRCPVYCAAKAGLHAFSIAQRIQLAPLGIRVVEVIPPAVDSELNPESRRARPGDTSYMMSADDFVAKVIPQLQDDADEVRVAMEWK